MKIKFKAEFTKPVLFIIFEKLNIVVNMTNILIVIGWLITSILSYVVGEKLHFTQRKKEKLEKFENAIDDYYLTAPSMSSNGVPSSKYDNFSAFYVTCKPIVF